MKKSLFNGLIIFVMVMFCVMTTAFADIALDPVQEIAEKTKEVSSNTIIYVFAILLVVLLICGLIIVKIVKKKS